MALATNAVLVAADEITDPDTPMLIAPAPDDILVTDDGNDGTDMPTERPTDEILLGDDGGNDTLGNGEENLYEALGTSGNNNHIPLSVLGLIGIGTIVALALVVLNRKQ